MKLLLLLLLLSFSGLLVSEAINADGFTPYEFDGTTRPDDLRELYESCNRGVLQRLAANLAILDSHAPIRDHYQFWRVIWSVRALQYLTGMKMTSTIALSPGQTVDRLLFNRNGAMTFYATWMSHGEIYLAPPTQQADIIQQWQKAATSLPCWKDGHVDPLDITDWYF